MLSSTSNFKRKLRLPRLFFPKPPEIIPRDYERPIPPVPWRGLTVVVVLIVIAAVSAWEFYCRWIGYRPTFNDNEDLWTMMRRCVKPESVVIIGDSRAWFDLDLDELQKGLGKRPVQLAMGGRCAYQVLADLANDENFHGTIICRVVPRLFVAPPGTPPMARAGTAVRRFHTQTLAPRAIKYLAMPLEEHVAVLEREEPDRARAGVWDRVIKDPGAPGIYYEDFPELSGFNCPEWSHLSAGDSVEFSKRLVPHLRLSLEM